MPGSELFEFGRVDAAKRNFIVRDMTEIRVPILIKRYGGHRFYDGTARRYITVADLRAWKENGISFMVIDVETGEDITVVLLA